MLELSKVSFVELDIALVLLIARSEENLAGAPLERVPQL